jgi:GcrA cell cycle regulator
MSTGAEIITLENLKRGMCKWPIGDPKHDDFHFCGCQKQPEQSYCDHHTKLAYRSSSRDSQQAANNSENTAATEKKVA